MKVTELRLGNWVNTQWYKDFKIVGLTVFEDKTAQCSIFKDLNYYPQSTNINDLHAIKITHEWLSKFGFKRFEENDSYQLDVKLGFSIWGRIKTGFNIYVESTEIGKSIKYVHQLQNIYFELTGKELIDRTQNK